jgi:hypothetical protein
MSRQLAKRGNAFTVESIPIFWRYGIADAPVARDVNAHAKSAGDFFVGEGNWVSHNRQIANCYPSVNSQLLFSLQ